MLSLIKTHQNYSAVYYIIDIHQGEPHFLVVGPLRGRGRGVKGRTTKKTYFFAASLSVENLEKKNS